eukprot:1146484-Pelagomonas_calceolata.AAC.1
MVSHIRCVKSDGKVINQGIGKLCLQTKHNDEERLYISCTGHAIESTNNHINPGALEPRPARNSPDPR